MPDFVVAMRAASAACFAPDDGCQVVVGNGPARLTLQFRTIYENGAPRWLEGWIVGPADSIDEAGEIYPNSVASFCTFSRYPRMPPLRSLIPWSFTKSYPTMPNT